MGSIFENLASAMRLTSHFPSDRTPDFGSGSPLGGSRHTSAEAYIVNLSDNGLILTALLPEDSDSHRSLLLGILDHTEAMAGHHGQAHSFQELNRERILKPGEVAVLALRKAPAAKHVSLFRVRKEGQPGVCFLKYTVKSLGPNCVAAITHLGTQNTLGKLESAHPHLIYVW